MSMIHYCQTCGDVGVVELKQDSFTTLANCYCSMGKKQKWSLPRIPLAGYSHNQLKVSDYKPNSLSNEARNEKIAWHLERMKTAESFWANEEARA